VSFHSRAGTHFWIGAPRGKSYESGRCRCARCQNIFGMWWKRVCANFIRFFDLVAHIGHDLRMRIESSTMPSHGSHVSRGPFDVACNWPLSSGCRNSSRSVSELRMVEMPLSVVPPPHHAVAHAAAYHIRRRASRAASSQGLRAPATAHLTASFALERSQSLWRRSRRSPCGAGGVQHLAERLSA